MSSINVFMFRDDSCYRVLDVRETRRQEIFFGDSCIKSSSLSCFRTCSRSCSFRKRALCRPIHCVARWPRVFSISRDFNWVSWTTRRNVS